jgi:hypothetical protein
MIIWEKNKRPELTWIIKEEIVHQNGLDLAAGFVVGAQH